MLIALSLYGGKVYAASADVLYDQFQGGRCAPALAMLERAATDGEATAQHVLAQAHYFGYCVTKDEREAVTWFRKTAEQGYAAAQFNLGMMDHNGRGVAQDEREAVA